MGEDSKQYHWAYAIILSKAAAAPGVFIEQNSGPAAADKNLYNVWNDTNNSLLIHQMYIIDKIIMSVFI